MTSLKIQAAKAALDYLSDVKIIGVGTGSTVNCFIEQLATIKSRIDACIASSNATAQRLHNIGINVIDLNDVENVPIYIDGADQVTVDRVMIKGGGGALTREKIIATAAKKFICIVDETKVVQQLSFPIAVEVLPIAQRYVTQELMRLGSKVICRVGFLTDNGNIILDAYNLNCTHAIMLEETINLIPGVIEHGLFAKRKANTILIASKTNVISISA